MSFTEDNPIRQALQHDTLPLPLSPPVCHIEPEPYVDSLGDDALKIWVVLADSTRDEQITAAATGAIENAIANRLNELGVDLFPYLFFAKQRDFEQRHDVS